MAIGTYISIITLKVNGIDAPTKRLRLTEWIQKHVAYRRSNSDIEIHTDSK